MVNEDKKEGINKVPFIETLISKAYKRSFSTIYKVPKSIDSYKQPYNLLEILGLNEKLLSDTANKTLNVFENNKDEKSISTYNNFKWKATAFTHIQDIFDSPLYKTGEVLNVFHIWYFYYESKYVLIESILSGLNGFYLASNALLRLFLEFSLLQNYYYRIVSNEISYQALELYFKNRHHPNWNTVINKCVENDKFTKPIKVRLDLHLKALSESSVHPYHPDSSPKQFGSFLPEPSLEGIYFWQTTRLILDAVLWLYYVNFPMLFHPVNVVKKFGFNAPVGLFIDDLGAYVIKKSLSSNDYKYFRNYSKEQQGVKDLFDFYNSRNDMNNEEILKTWDSKEDGPIKNISEGHCKQMVKLRGLKEGIALKRVKYDQEEAMNNDEILQIFNYEKWKEIYRSK